jgi:hypothetical protein
MAAETCEIEVWVMVNENGEYEVGCDEDEVGERYSDNINDNLARRAVKVILTVPMPKPVTMRGTVPAEAEGEFALSVG